MSHDPAPAPPADPAADDLGFALPAAAPTSRVRVAIAIAVVVAAAFAFGWLRRDRASASPPAVATPRAPRVEVIRATAIDTDRALTLPGTVRALEQTRVYPRITGYVRRWLVDLGDRVTAGQVLCEIDAPELAAQLAQARAQLAQAEAAVKQVAAQRDYARQSSQRIAGLADQQLVARAQLEQSQAQAQTDEATVAAAEANVAAQQANVRRLIETAGFARVVAPFAGTIVARGVERGDLVSEAKATPLFTIAATDPLRVFVDAPQSVVAGIRAGATATLTVRELPGRKFPGKITRAAGALDPELHTMSTEIQVPNADGALLPGMYVQVELALPVPHRVLEIPATALYSDAQGLRVAVIDGGERLRFAPITIERDTGPTLHIATGLTGDERIVKIAVPGLVDGDAVEVAAAPAGAGSAGPRAGSAAAGGR